MTRTTRIQGEYASQGAVRQAGGRLELYRCNTCQANVAWATSKRTGRKYLVNVSHGHGGQAFYIGSNIHTDDQCAKRVADNDAYIRRLTVEAIAARMCDLTSCGCQGKSRRVPRTALQRVDTLPELPWSARSGPVDATDRRPARRPLATTAILPRLDVGRQAAQARTVSPVRSGFTAAPPATPSGASSADAAPAGKRSVHGLAKPGGNRWELRH